ncbi:hypothetical protein AAY81_04450 [Denitrobacterium detoxificans]|uniref:YdjC-like protein n=1 Tax=Denitrobacterium detoxificans TaxID=79604 RepID=A0A172RXP4_9ACTN|nr:ChbG/HpnK family deacetylase [Denitrobacterium detoxificans]ANE22497.1 hypothetical protein AAY81_04450 [Denitrobacterium detoxificans]SEO79552.1 YdjC-like protein [Denitrobacterium detoxificans]
MTYAQAPDIIYHADDYGITPAQSELILSYAKACGGTGALNSVSVMVNAPSFSESIPLLQKQQENILASLHVNVVEGPCCADPKSIPLLVDDKGIFRQSFASMLKLSFSSQKAKLTNQLSTEIGAQLDRHLAALPHAKDALRIDSHQHFHLIPAVFDALLRAVESRGCTIAFLRIPAEPVLPFLKTPRVWLRIPAINWVKHWLLNFLWRMDKKNLPNYQDISAIFCGINFSGHMTPERVAAVLPAFKAYARKRNMPLELLFHPGAVPQEDALNPKLTGFVEFYTSPLRGIEGEALRSL